MLPLLPAHQFAIGASRFWPGTNCHLCERSTDSKRAWQKQQESVKTWVGTCQVRKLNKTNLVKHGFHTFLRCWGLDGKLGKNKPPLCKILADLGVSKFQIFDFQGVQALRRTRYKEALTEIIKHVDTCCPSQIICVSAMCAVSIYKSINQYMWVQLYPVENLLGKMGWWLHMFLFQRIILRPSTSQELISLLSKRQSKTYFLTRSVIETTFCWLFQKSLVQKRQVSPR